MFRTAFGVLAALLVTSTTSSASEAPSKVSLEQRIAKAKVTMVKLGELNPVGQAPPAKASSDEVQVAQHWHNHHWNDWRNWNNWRNHWHNHH
ncbi:MAG: hypothetical protein NW205_03390 [Hyphomicrobiaceae bacterium]|nr:hypothetical protein [Hyphomicrobiaceae bacterium]